MSRSVAVAFAVMLGFAGPAGAAESRAVLRHLVYSVNVGASTVTEVKRSGFGQNGGNSEDFGIGGIINKGTISLDVLSVTSDGALVMDIAESAEARTTPKTRVAVFDDGRVLFDPSSTPLMPESLELLRLCARRVFDEHAATAGAKWTEDHVQPSGTETTAYETSDVSSDRSLVRFTRTISGKGIAAPAQMRAAIWYDRHYLMPIAASLGKLIRTDEIDQIKYTKVTWQIRLLEDSFSKTAAAVGELPSAVFPVH